MMNSEPAKQSAPVSDRKLAFKRFLKAITYRWGWKLSSLLIALVLWASLITQNTTLVREKVFNNVSVNIVNAAALQRNGFIVVDGLDDLGDVRIRVDVPQRNYSSVTASNYNVRIDLSQITGAGEQQVSLVATSTSTYGTVTDISLKQVTVMVEEYITRSRIPVRVEASGSAPGGFYTTSASVDPMMVTISGPRSVVSSVARCVAIYDMSLLQPTAGTERTAADFQLYDRNNLMVDRSLITVTNESVVMDSIIVEQTLYPSLTVAIDRAAIVHGYPAEGYHVKDITLSPEEVRVAGNDLSATFGDTFYLSRTIDIDGATQSVSGDLFITRPSGVVYMSTDVVHVTIEIEPDAPEDATP